jgi:hypothetical protein
MGNQKIPKGYSEDNKEVIRRYQRGNQKILKGQSEAVNGTYNTNVLQHTVQKTKGRAARIPLKTGDEPQVLRNGKHNDICIFCFFLEHANFLNQLNEIQSLICAKHIFLVLFLVHM